MVVSWCGLYVKREIGFFIKSGRRNDPKTDADVPVAGIKPEVI